MLGLQKCSIWPRIGSVLVKTPLWRSHFVFCEFNHLHYTSSELFMMKATLRSSFGILCLMVVFATQSISAQRTIHLSTESGFDPFGFTTKLTTALQHSSIGARFKSMPQADLEKINATKQGDLAVQIVSNELLCSGSKTIIISIIFVELGRDKTNSVQKIYIGSSTGYITERSVDTDVEQYRDIIVNALASR